MTTKTLKAEKAAQDARVALARKIFHTYAIGAGGGGAALLVTKGFGPEGSIWGWVGLFVAVALHIATIYIAPVSPEKSDD